MTMALDGFRRASNEDVDAIVALVNLAYRPPAGATGWTHESEWVSGERINRSQLQALLNKPNATVLVGLQRGQIAACVLVEQEGSAGYIGMLAVNPTLQGGGAGKQMLAQSEAYAVQAFGAEKFVMVVLSSRAELIAFYLRRGYRRTGITADYPLDAGVGVPKRADLSIETLEKPASAGIAA